MTIPSPTTIREMTEADIPRVLEIECESFPVPWSEELFRGQLRLGNIAINLVLLEAGVIIGYATAWVAQGEVHLLSIAVLPEKRGRGNGTAILNEVIRRGRSMDGAVVVLEVRVGNSAARAFYDRRGFEVIHTRRRYYRDSGEDALVMVLMLGDS